MKNGFRVWGLGMKIMKNGFRVWGLGMKIMKNGFRNEGMSAAYTDQHALALLGLCCGFRVFDFWFRVCGVT